MSTPDREAVDEPGPAWPSCPFWDWAVAFYARPGVAEACLALQDRSGHDVVLILFALWLAERGRRVDERLAGHACELSGGWRTDVVAPLRTLRRRLKAGLAEPPNQHVPEARQPAQVTALRARLKVLELASERLQILALADLAEGLPAAGAPVGQLADANLAALLGRAPFDLRARSTLLGNLAPQPSDPAPVGQPARSGDQAAGGSTGSTRRS